MYVCTAEENKCSKGYVLKLFTCYKTFNYNYLDMMFTQPVKMKIWNFNRAVQQLINDNL